MLDTVIPTKAKALFNREAGQSGKSDAPSTPVENSACFALRIRTGSDFRRNGAQKRYGVL